MKKEYQKPEVEIISFMAEETIATAAEREAKEGLPEIGDIVTSGMENWD